MSRKHVLVVNQFAMPRTEWGLTRNADLFGRLRDWETCIVAANRDHYGQRTFTTTDPLFRLVPVPSYSGAGTRRVFGWMSFGVQAVLIGLRRRPLDLVFASSPQLLAPLAAWLVAAVRRKPFVLEIRDLWPESIVEAGHARRGSLLHRALVLLERFLYGQARHIVVVTPGWAPHFAALGIDSSKITVIPNGTDIGDPVTPEKRTKLRLDHGVTGFTAVYAGAHGPANGLDQVLDAAASLPDVNFLLIGAGAEKDRLQARALQESLSNVSFRSPVPKAQLAALLAACDVGIHVLAPWQLLESGLSPNKVFDYMAAGLPLVSNCREGLRSVVQDGQCGPLGAGDELAACLKQVRDSSAEQRTAWAANGRNLVHTRFSRAHSSELLASVLAQTSGSTQRRDSK